MSTAGLFSFLIRRLALFVAALLVQFGLARWFERRRPESKAWRWTIRGLFTAANLPFGFIFVDWVGGWKLDGAWYRAVVFPFTVWQVASLFVGGWVLALWVTKKVRSRGGAEPTMDRDKRRFLLAGAGAAAAGGVVFASKGLGVGAGRAVVRRVSIAVSGLPDALDGMRIIQITDIHCGYFYDRERLQRLAARVNRLGPDLVVLTGDQVHAFHGGFVQDMVEGLSGLSAPGGVVAILGNHDYRAGADLVISAMESVGWLVLRNQGTRISVRGSSLFVAGIDDWTHGPDLSAALSHRDDGPVLLLSHRPDVFHQAVDAGVDVVLVGHTHGGQIRLGPLDPALFAPFVRGLYRSRGTTMYVCPGVGLTGPPLRIGVPPELGLVVLRRVRTRA